MRSLFGSLLALSVLLAFNPLSAQEAGRPNGPVTVAGAPGMAEPAVAPAAAETLPWVLAAVVAAELTVPPPPVPITLVLKADLRSQRLTVTEGGKVKHVWPISSGRPGFATRTGTFRPQWASRMHYSRQYDLAPMPHAVFFNQGAAFHGTEAVAYLGRPASHGCIRLAPADAARLYGLVHRHGFYQTKVIVHGGSSDTKVARGANPEGRKALRGPGARDFNRDVNGGERRKRSRYSRYNGGAPWSY